MKFCIALGRKRFLAMRNGRKEEDELISLISQTKKMISRLEEEAAERKRKNRW